MWGGVDKHRGRETGGRRGMEQDSSNRSGEVDTGCTLKQNQEALKTDQVCYVTEREVLKFLP